MFHRRSQQASKSFRQGRDEFRGRDIFNESAQSRRRYRRILAGHPVIPFGQSRHGSLELTHLQLTSLQDKHVLVVIDVMLDNYLARCYTPGFPSKRRPHRRCGVHRRLSRRIRQLRPECREHRRQVHLLGCIGDDAPGDALKHKIDVSRVSQDLVSSSDASTTLKLWAMS